MQQVELRLTRLRHAQIQNSAVNKMDRLKLTWQRIMHFDPLWTAADWSFSAAYFVAHHRPHQVTHRSFQRLNYPILREVEVGCLDCSQVGYGTMGLYVHIFIYVIRRWQKMTSELQSL